MYRVLVFFRVLLGVWLVIRLGAGDNPVSAAESVRLASPNGRLELVISCESQQNAAGLLSYQIFFDQQPIMPRSQYGLRLSDGIELGTQCEMRALPPRMRRMRFLQHPGKQRIVDQQARELVIEVTQRSQREIRWELVARAYNDGIAFRYRIPPQDGWETLELAAEETTFTFPPDTTVTYLPLASHVTSHESYYASAVIGHVPRQQLIGVPLLAEIPGSGWAAILEAELKHAGGLYLQHSPDQPGTLVSKLSPLPEAPSLVVKSPLPFESPWRVVLIAQDLARLLESEVVLSLNAPSRIADTSWIKPGKTTFPWWNGYYEEEVPFVPGLTTETVKHYLDFCAEYGIPYHSLDGVDNTAWYGGPIVPYAGADPTTAVAGLDLPEVLASANQKHVRLRLWLHWQAAQAHMRRAFPLYRQWGIEGVMIDFMDRDDQEMVEFLGELLALAAENRLTVTLHGVAPPTGLERTFPNLLTSEGVLNLEYNKWDTHGVPSRHDLHAAQIRMLSGPLDYHQGSLRTVSAEDFHARERAPLVIGTPSRTAATYVIFHNHLPMMADYPTAYRQQSLTRLLAAIPATWEETRCLAADLGQSLVMARRQGTDWWIGAMTDGSGRQVVVPLAVLDRGAYQATIYQDDPAAAAHYSQTVQEVTAGDSLTLVLQAGGGAVVHLTPAAADERPGWELAWGDEFTQLDPQRWVVTNSGARDDGRSLPHVRDGILVVPASSAVPPLEVRGGAISSATSQRFGRWDIRARLPKTPGLRASCRLLPPAPWPTAGEIEPVVFLSDQPQVTASAFHWGSGAAGRAGSRSIQQRSLQAGQQVDYSAGFHTFSVEWVADQLRFYVDDLFHTVYYSDEVGDFLPRLTEPMHLVCEVNPTSVPAPSEFSDSLEIDWVRVFRATGRPTLSTLTNGSFEAGGGSLRGWHVFGNRLTGPANVTLDWRHCRSGHWALSLGGQGTGSENYSGITQGIPVAPGQRVSATLTALVAPRAPIRGPQDRATVKIEFYSNIGDYFGGPAMRGFREITIGTDQTIPNQWQDFELTATAPPEAVEARLSIVYYQQADQPGTIFVDDVRFSTAELVQ